MKRKVITIALAALILTAAMTTVFLLRNSPAEETNVKEETETTDKTGTNYLYTYPIGVPSGKTFIVTVETNRTPGPKVELPQFDTNKYVIVYFWDGNITNMYFNVTIPTSLLWGNISLVWKYYLQNPDRYTLSNNETHNSVYMAFQYSPYFSGRGWFQIGGTEAAW